MEKSEANTDSTGVCEKIYNAVAANAAFRAIHRKSGRSHCPIAAITDTNKPGVQTADTAAIAHVPVAPKNILAQHKAGPGEVNVPIELGPSIVPKEKENMAKPPVSIHNSGRMTISSAKIDPSNYPTRKEDTSRTNSVPQTTKPTTVIVHIQGHVDDVESKVELFLPQPEKLKTTVGSGHGPLNKITSIKEAKPAVSSLMEEKLEQNRVASPNIVVRQNQGQGFNVSPKVEPAKPPNMSVQERQPKTKVQADSIVKTMSKRNDQPNLHDEGDHEGKKTEHDSVNDKFSNYITQVRNKLRTPSNVGEEATNPKPATNSATGRDSFNDRVANYIHRARKNIRTPSSVGDA